MTILRAVADYEIRTSSLLSGYVQRVVPSVVAAGGNEIISAPEFQQNAFSESGYFRKSRWAGNYEVIVAGKGYVTRYGDG